MKRLVQYAFVYLLMVALFTSCEVIGDIFKAGMGFGIFLVLAVVVLIIFLISKFLGKK